MTNTQKSVRVTVVQAAPVIMDRGATVGKTLTLIKEASSKGAQIVVFPEAFISAYPRGLSFGAVVGSRTVESREDWLRYYESSITVPGEVTDILGQAAADANIYLVIGVIEKDGGTLYCTLLYFGPDGKLLAKHRKLKPTGLERFVWGEGDGSTLSVVDTPYGKMGGLICWENYMPLARTAMYMKGVSIYVAPTADARDEWQSTIRHIALEGRCFVLSCNQFVTKDMYPKDLKYYRDLEAQPDIMCRGGSAVVDPLGRYVTKPVYNRKEILVADLDLDMIIKSRLDFDPVGHYSRPDVFELIIRE
jgi:nitrilase